MNCPRKMRKRSPAGFTLIELLTVVGIIGVLTALILPAVQAARESSRRTACKNHLSQLAKGMIQHESQHGYFPTGGWSPDWIGTADRASDSSQPGGWTFTVLPFIEEIALQDAVAGTTPATQQSAYGTLCSSPVSNFVCPSRRTSKVLPVSNSRWATAFKTSVDHADATVSINLATRVDFAANGGSIGPCLEMPMAKFVQVLSRGGAGGGSGRGQVKIGHRPPGNPDNCNEITVGVTSLAGHANHPHDTIGGCDPGDCDQFMDAEIVSPADLDEGDRIRGWQLGKRMVELDDAAAADVQDGLVARMSRVAAGSILDGLSNVYLIGEKYVSTEKYETGDDKGDASILYAGYSASNVRWASQHPRADDSTENNATASAFGSAHSGTWNAAFGDGSVRSLGYDIDSEVHKNLAAKSPRFPGEVLGDF